eukprot:6966504-Prymnesium_polylepis.1
MRSAICHSCIPLAGLRQRGELALPLLLQLVRVSETPIGLVQRATAALYESLSIVDVVPP